MPRIFQIVKRVTEVVAGGTTNWRATAGAGFSHNTRATVSPTSAPAGFDVDIAPFSVRSPQPAGFSQTITGATGTAAQLSAPSGFSHNTNATVSPVAAPGGFDIIQATYTVDGAYPTDAVSETAVSGRTDWANDANATGPVNGTTATIAGNAAAARGGRLDFDFPNFPNKASLTVTSVAVDFYVSQSGTIAGNGDMRLLTDTGGAGFVIRETITGDVSNLVTPRTFTVTGITAFSQLDSFRAAVRFEATIGETQTAAVDAVVLRVTASATETY